MFKARTVKARGVKTAGSRRGARGPGGLMLAGPVMTVLCVAALPAVAGPRGERVVRGEASFQRQGRSTTITASDRTIIEYDSFNIGRRQSVEFVQPGAGSRVLNRISGADPSSINGTLKSNGIVYIVNPAGVIFGPNSVVDVGGIYAAAATITDQDFVQGNDHFTNVQGRVVNRGTINADSMANLIGRRVANFGTVVADTGTVTMVAGDEVWIGERDGHVYARFSTDAARERAGGVANHGTVSGDQVLAGVGDYFALALFEPGAVRARIVEVRGGQGTTTEVAGVIDASNRVAGGVGGSVTVTGERVALRGATIDASGDAGGGSVRVGGDYQGRGDIPNAQRTYVAPGTTINADAVTTGDGGRVIVWSDVFTNYHGSISARGGAQGGDGGFAEISGKQTLAFNGTAHMTAVDGRHGTVLLDPQDITIENGGAAPVASNNEFTENPGTPVSMDADLITAITNTGAAVMLDANRDITISEAITSNNPGGNGGDITLRAGRRVLINANITTDSGNLSITANETAANGVQNANKTGEFAASIAMANNVLIDAGAGNVTMTLSTGAGLTFSNSGNIVVEDITTTGTVTLTNNGPTAGSSIVIEPTGSNSLITAGNLAMSVGGAGGGGGIGTSADPIEFVATNVEASAQSLGIFLDTTSTTNVGGASGSLTGLATSSGGAIELSTGAGNLTTSEAIGGAGTVTLTGTAINAGANIVGGDDVVLTGPLTITGSRTISAGAGQLDIVNAVTMSGAAATVTLIGTPSGATPAINLQANVTPDGGGTVLVLEQATNATAFNVATGTGDLLEATNGFDRLLDGFTSITAGRSDGTQSVAVGALTVTDPLTIRTNVGNINLNGALAGTGNASLTLTPGAASRVLFNTNGTILSTANQAITINGAARVGEGFASTVTTGAGAGNISITGLVDGVNGGGTESLVFNAGTGALSTGVLGTGQANDLQTVTITNAGVTTIGGASLLGAFTTTNALTGAFNATGAVSVGSASLNGLGFDFDAATSATSGLFQIGSTAATTLNFDSTLTGVAGGITLTGTTMGFTGLLSTSASGDITLNGSAITATAGITAAGAGADIGITNSGLLSLPGAVSAAGSFTQTNNVTGTVSVAAAVTGLGVTFNSPTTISGTREVSATTGALAFNSTLTFSGAAATGTLTGSTIAFAGNVTPQAGQTSLVFQSPDTTTAFGVGTGTANQMISSASVAFLQEGFTALTFGRSAASHNIAVGGVSFSDPVTFRTTTAGNITVSGLLTGTDDATVLLDTGAGPARIILDVTGNAIVTAGDLIDFSGLVRVAEGESPTINSAGGTIRFGGAVDGTTGGAAEALTLNAGAGSIDFQTVASAVSGASGASDATGLATLTITNAAGVSLQSLLISGTFSTTNALTGAFQSVGSVNAGTISLNGTTFDFDAAVTGGAGGVTIGNTAATTLNFDSTLTGGAGGINLTGTTMTFDALVSTSGGGDVVLDGSTITVTGGITTAGAGANVDITNSAVLDIDGAVTANGTFTQNDNGGTVSLGANVDTSGADGALQFNSAVTATTAVTLNSGAGAIDLNSTFAAGANNVVFTTNDFQPSGADTVTGTGTVTLRPENVGDSIDLGTAATGATATYTLADFAALADGFSAIHVGYVTTGTHTVNMSGFSGGAALRDDLAIHAPAGAGQITLLDDLDVGSESLTFDGAFLAGANLDIDSNAAGSVTFSQTAGFQAFDVSLTGDALPTFTGAISGSGTLTIRPDAIGTAIDIGDVVGAGGALQGGLVVSEAVLQTLNDVDFAALEFGFATTGTHSIQIGDTTGVTAFNSDATFHAPAGAGLISVLADQAVDSTGNANATGNMTFDGPVVMGNAATITVEDLLTFEQTLDMDGNATTLASGDLDFNGGANSVSNGGVAAVLSLSPSDDSADIDIGNLGGNARGGAWSLDATDLAALDASVGALGFGTPVTGSHVIFLGLIASLNFDATFNAPAAGGEVRLFDDVTSGGNDLTFNADLRVANAATPTIDSGGGNVVFNFDIFGSTTGAGETLTVDSGSGDITVTGFIAGQSTGVSNATGLTAVSLIGDNISIAAVDISGAFSADNAGILAISDDVDADGGFAQTNTTLSGTSAVTLGADITTVNTTIDFASDVTQTADVALTAGTGLIEISAGTTFDTDGNDLTLAARRIDILGTLTGGDGTNTLTMVPDAVGTAIELGTGTSLAAGALVLSSTDIGNIDNGFAGIVIGFAGTGAHAFEIGGAGFVDPLTLNAPAAGGSFTVLAGRTLSGTDDASLTFNGSHSTLTLSNGSRITTAGTDIDIDDNILLADGAGNSNVNADIPLISTGAGAGNIRIDGSIRGTDNLSGMVERLRVQAGTGTLTVGDVLVVNATSTNIFGALSGITEVASAEGLIDFRIVSAAGATLEGVNIAGSFRNETALTGGLTANGSVLARSITLSGTTFDFLDGFSATNNGGGNAAFTNSGLVMTTEGESSGDLTTTGSLTATTLDAGGNVSVGGDLILGDEAAAGGNFTVTGTSTIGDRIAADGSVTLTGNVLFATNGGASDRGLFAGVTLTTGGGLDTNAQDVTLSGAEINFNGGARSVTGGGALAIEPDTAARDINIGQPTGGNPGATSLDLTDADLAAIDDGFDVVTIGIAGGTHDMVLGTSTFRNRMVFNYQAGTALINGALFGSGPTASMEFLGGDSGGTTLSANITTAGGGILFDDNVTLGAASILSTGGGAGTVEIDGTLNGPFAFTAIGGAGDVEIDGTIGAGVALASLALSGDNVTLFGGIGSVGSAGVTGVTAITATSFLLLGGETYNTNEAFYQAQTSASILGNGSGTTATFTSNSSDLTFDGGGEFEIDDGVGLTINSGAGVTNIGADFSGMAAAILFSGPVVLTADTQIDNEGAGAGSTVTFADTVDGGFDLGVTTAGGGIFFQGDIGGSDALANLSVESAAGIDLENIGAGGATGVEGNVTLVSNAGDNTFNGTFYGMGSATLAASGQHSVASGATTFSTRGGNLTFAGGDIVLTNGSDLTATTEGGDGTFTNIRGDSDENVTIDLAGGTGFFEEIGQDDQIGDILMTLGNVALNGNIFGNTFTLRGGSPGRSIEIAGDNSTPAAVRISRSEFARLREGFSSITFGRADGTNAIVVGGDGGGPLGFTDPLTLLSPATSSTITIREALVGSGNASLTVTATEGTVLLSSDITTAGQNVTIDGATLLGADVSIATAGGNVSFGGRGTINSQAAAAALMVDAGAGDVTIGGDAGAATALASIDLTGTNISIEGVSTEDDQTYTGELALNGNLTSQDGAILVDGSTTLGTDVSVSAGLASGSADVDVTFRGSIDGGGNSLTVATGTNGTASFEGAVTNAETIGVGAGTINVGDVTSTGQQNYTASDQTNLGGTLRRTGTGGITISGDLVLVAESTISTTGGTSDDDITLDGDVDGAFGLGLVASGGNILVTGDMGSNERLGDLTITSARSTTLESVTVANFFQTAGSGATILNGSLDANGTTGVILSARSFRFSGPVNVGNDLSLTSAEVSRFNGTVTTGGEASLLGGSFRIGNDASDTFDVGGSFLVNSTGNLIISAPVTVRGNQGADLNMVDMVLSAAFEVEDGQITLTNAGTFTLQETGSIVLNGNNFRQDGTGDSRLANGILSTGSNISFDGDVILTDDLTFRGQSLAFNGRVDSDAPGTLRSLVLNSGGPTILAGGVGTVNPLASLRTNINGQTRLAGDVVTAGSMLFGDNVVLLGDTRLDTSAGGSAGTVEFMGTINSETAGSPRSLTIITDVTILDHTLPTITFNQPIGDDAALNNLFLNFDPGVVNGRLGLAPQDITINGFTIPGVVTPLVPTIVVPFFAFDPGAPESQREFSIEIAGDFRMGVGEKMSVTFAYDIDPNTGAFVLDNRGRHFVNGVTIDPATNAPTFVVITGGDAIFGDLTIDGNLRVGAIGDISFQGREAAVILPKPLAGDDEDSYPGDPALLDVDRGADLVVNGIARFNKGPTAAPGTFLGTTDLAATIAAGDTGDLIVLQLESDVFTANDFFMTAEEAGRVLGLSSFLFLDLRSEGSTGSQPPIFGQVPNESQSGTVTQATAIGSVAKRALADLGINARDPEDLLDALIGRALYNDLSAGEGDASYVTANRMSLDIATDLVNEYNAFFRRQVMDEDGNPQFDPETGEALYESRAAEIKATLTAAVQAYRRQSGGRFDAIGFRQFTQSTPEHAEAEQDLQTLGRLLGQFQILGLSSGEFAQARLALLRLVRPSQGLNDQQFIAVIDAGDGVLEGADSPAPQEVPGEEVPAGG